VDYHFIVGKLNQIIKAASTNVDENSSQGNGTLHQIANQKVKTLIYKRPIASASSTIEFKGGSWPYLALP
jgi:hypothetical protein